MNNWLDVKRPASSCYASQLAPFVVIISAKIYMTERLRYPSPRPQTRGSDRPCRPDSCDYAWRK